MKLHNICGHGHCRWENCTGCSFTNYYIVIGDKEYHLPRLVQIILRKLI